MNARTAMRRLAFRFGLTGRRWGDSGPAVLLLHGAGPEPETFGDLVEPLVASGRQVLLLDDPTDESASHEARVAEYAAAIAEAAVEIDELEAVVAHGLAAAAAAQALAQGLNPDSALLLGSGSAAGADAILDGLLEREVELPLAA